MEISKWSQKVEFDFNVNFLKKGGGIVQLESRPPLMLGVWTCVRIPVRA